MTDRQNSDALESKNANIAAFLSLREKAVAQLAKQRLGVAPSLEVIQQRLKSGHSIKECLEECNLNLRHSGKVFPAPASNIVYPSNEPGPTQETRETGSHHQILVEQRRTEHASGKDEAHFGLDGPPAEPIVAIQASGSGYARLQPNQTENSDNHGSKFSPADFATTQTQTIPDGVPRIPRRPSFFQRLISWFRR